MKRVSMDWVDGDNMPEADMKNLGSIDDDD